MSVQYLQSAQSGLVADVRGAGNATDGCPLQALDKKPRVQPMVDQVPVPGWPGYFWIPEPRQSSFRHRHRRGVKSGSQLKAVVTEFDENQFWQTFDVPGGARYFLIASAVEGLVVDIDSAGGVKSGSRLQVLGKKSAPNQYWKWVEPAEAPAPSSGSGSWSNYFLYGGTTAKGDYIPLGDVDIAITITEDLVGTPPFSFQLNALSPEKLPATSPQFLDAWQQYGISLAPGSTQFNSFANNWSVTGLKARNRTPCSTSNLTVSSRWPIRPRSRRARSSASGSISCLQRPGRSAAR